MKRSTITLVALAALFIKVPIASAQLPPAVSNQRNCSIGVRLDALPEHPDELLITLRGQRAERASGTVTLYANERKYSIAFTDAIVAGLRDPTTLPTPVVVRLPAPATIESAYLGTLYGEPCPIFNPTTTSKSASGSPFGDAVWRRFVGSASAVEAISSGPSVAAEPLLCAKPSIPASVRRAVGPLAPIGSRYHGPVQIQIEIDAAGALVGASVYASSHDRLVDDAALQSALASSYNPQVYRCQTVPGSFRFIVIFN
jgi:TonB family protein